MLAKIVAHGADRAEALARLTEALDETVVLGLTTNLRFLRWLVRQPAVAAARPGSTRSTRSGSRRTRAGRSDRIPAGGLGGVAARRLDAGGWRLNGPPGPGSSPTTGSGRSSDRSPSADAAPADGHRPPLRPGR